MTERRYLRITAGEVRNAAREFDHQGVEDDVSVELWTKSSPREHDYGQTVALMKPQGFPSTFRLGEPR